MGRLKLLVRAPNWLGDLVMSMGALTGIAKGRDEVSYCLPANLLPLVGVFLPGSEALPSGEPIPRGRFDSLLLMTDSFSSAWAGFTAGIPERIGHSGQFRRLLLTHPVRPLPGRNHHHSIDYERLAEEAGFHPAAPTPAPGPCSGEKHLAVFPGAAFGRAKMWPSMPEAAGLLARRTGLAVVFYGSSSEAGQLMEMASGVDGSIVRAGLPLDELAARLSCAMLALGNDSGGAHLAASLGVPTVVVYGSTSAVWTAPLGRSVRIVKGRAACSPCFRRTCPEDSMECFSTICVEDVVKAAMDIFDAA